MMIVLFDMLAIRGTPDFDSAGLTQLLPMISWACGVVGIVLALIGLGLLCLAPIRRDRDLRRVQSSGDLQHVIERYGAEMRAGWLLGVAGLILAPVTVAISAMAVLR